MNMIYLDNAATTRMSVGVIDEMVAMMNEQYGNPSAIYDFAIQNKIKLEKAREDIALALGVRKQEIYFTSGGSEADNWALIGIAEAYQKRGKHIITSKVEHKAVLNTCNYLEGRGFEISYLDVDENGSIDLQQLENEIREDTILISIMYANNEVGTIMPIEEIAKIAHKHDIIYHSDAVQAFGHIPIDCSSVPISLLSASGHKFHGPKGVGFLFIREGTNIVPLIRGGKQERGLRAGTENVINIVGMAKAAEECLLHIDEDIIRQEKLKQYFEQEITSSVDGIKINGYRKNSLPSNLNLCIENVDGILLVDSLSRSDICISTGSACNSNLIEPSHVLTAMGFSEQEAKTSVRISLSRYTTKDELENVLEVITQAIQEIREIYYE